MNAADLIRECRRRGVRLLVDGGELRYVGPRSAIEPEFLLQLRQAKRIVVAILTALDREEIETTPTLDLDQEAFRERFEERAAIIEFDAGFPRVEAERRAWASILRTEVSS